MMGRFFVLNVYSDSLVYKEFQISWVMQVSQ